jgi:hypothetical protein
VKVDPKSSKDQEGPKLLWVDLTFENRDLLSGKLKNLYGAASDADAFNSLPPDKQQALLLLLRRMNAKGLWHAVQAVENVYGLGGVGMGFRAWPMIESALSRRSDFTRRFAKHRNTQGGFYEKGRPGAVLHFIFQDGNPRRWYVHFDLHSPVFSVNSLLSHLRAEVLGKLTPDWQMIQESLNPKA